MSLSRNEIRVNSSWQKALINHFIRELFGEEGVRATVPEFPEEEYRRVLAEFTAGNVTSLQNSIESAPNFFNPHDQEVLLSFFKHHAIKMLDNSEIVPVKDHLANHLCVTAALRLER